MPPAVLRLGVQVRRRAAGCWTASSTSCPARSTCPPVKGHDPKDHDKVIERKLDPNEPFCGLAFKIVDDKLGTLTYVRVYSGKLEQGTRVLNANKGSKENISRMFQMSANDRIPRDVAEAGDIVAVIGVNEAMTGDTLCDLDDPIILERPTFPEPVISMSIEPKTAADKDKLGEALTNLRRQDPTFQANYNEETGETIIAGMGELHLEIIKLRLTRDYKVDVHRRQAEGRYRETITGKAEDIRGKHVKQSGGRGQFGDCTINIEPFDGIDPDGKPLDAEDAQEARLGRRRRLREQDRSAARSRRNSSRRSSTASAWPPRPACWRASR